MMVDLFLPEAQFFLSLAPCMGSQAKGRKRKLESTAEMIANRFKIYPLLSF